MIYIFSRKQWPQGWESHIQVGEVRKFFERWTNALLFSVFSWDLFTINKIKTAALSFHLIYVSMFVHSVWSLHVNSFCWSVPPVKCVGYRRLRLVLVILHDNQHNSDEGWPSHTKIHWVKTVPAKIIGLTSLINICLSNCCPFLLLMRYRSLGV